MAQLNVLASVVIAGNFVPTVEQPPQSFFGCYGIGIFATLAAEFVD